MSGRVILQSMNKEDMSFLPQGSMQSTYKSLEYNMEKTKTKAWTKYVGSE